MFAPLSLAALNHLLAQADWARQRLTPFAGRTARLAMPPWQLDFSIAADGRLAPADPAVAAGPDVTMTLPADAPLRMLQGQDKVIEAAAVSGNAQFATELSFVLRELRWDVEEDLSRLVGDIAAHRIAGGGAKVIAWQQDAARRLAENLAEYAAEEASLLVHSRAAAEFAADIGRLREAVARLDKRLETLVG